VAATLLAGEPLFAKCLDTHPPFGDFVRHEDTLMYRSDHEAIDVHPFFLPSPAATPFQTLLIYGGVSGNKAVFTSQVGDTHRSRDAYHAIVRTFATSAATETLDDHCPPDHLSDRLRQVTERTVRRMTQLRQYRPEITVDRAEMDLVLAEFMSGDDRLLLIDGLQGAGKTTWICRAAERRLEQGCAVLLETADRLSGQSLPHRIGAVANLKGSVTDLLQSASVASADERVLLAIDDLDAGTSEDSTVAALSTWVETLATDSPLRVVATIRSDTIRWWSSHLLHSLPLGRSGPRSLAPFSRYEIELLSDRIPAPPEIEQETARAERRACAHRLAISGDAALRRPGLAVPVLEHAARYGVTAALSVPAIYNQIVANDILDSRDGKPRYPVRINVVTNLAATFMRRGWLQTRLDSGEPFTSKLLDPTGTRSADYEALLSNGVLTERVEEFVTHVAFADPRLLAYLAAHELDTTEPQNTLVGLAGRFGAYSPALATAAFYVLRVLRGRDIPTAVHSVLACGGQADVLLLELASFDSASASRLVVGFPETGRARIVKLLGDLMDAGEAMIALTILDALLSSANSVDTEWLAAIRRLRVRGLYEVDDYYSARLEIERKADDIELLEWRAEILASCGEFQEARFVLEQLLDPAVGASALQRAARASGLGYALMHLGHLAEAEMQLQSAVSVLREGTPRLLSEALSQLGEVFIRQGRMIDARGRFEESLAISRDNGLYVGVGITLGFLAEVDLWEGRWQDAEQRLEKALDVHRRAGNRWREAWTLLRLERLCQLTNRPEMARRYAADAASIFTGIGVVNGHVVFRPYLPE
jgi:tetratricopeptide (TPR) repeat protein